MNEIHNQEKPKISVICCYNDPELYQNMLQKSLACQNIKCEMIGLDNTRHLFKNAADALNYGAQLANGDILVFAHQDIELLEENVVFFIEKAIKEHPQTIIGCAGANPHGIFSCITHGKFHAAVGTPIQDFRYVQTIDEMLICIRKRDFDKVRFDRHTCLGWHLYGVDLCLSSQNIGIHTAVLPLAIYHLSAGKITKEFYKTLIRILKKHKKTHTYLYTTTFLKIDNFDEAIRRYSLQLIPCYATILKVLRHLKNSI